MSLDRIWQDYGFSSLEQGIGQFFPESSVGAKELFSMIMSGDVMGAMEALFRGNGEGLLGQLAGMKSVFLWLLVLGIVSSLMSHFVDIFENHQVADLSFYFMYLLFAVVLMQCFQQSVEIAEQTMDNIVLFIRLMIPAYLISVGVATGTATATVACQILLLVIYGVEILLTRGVLPLTYSYMMLSVVNGVWAEEKLGLLIELMEKCVGWILKGTLGVITGISMFQALVTPVVDSAKTSALQKIVSAIPGVGHLADGVVELVLGSALVVKRSVGVFILLVLLAMCAVPLFKIGMIALVLKCAAAFVGIVSDKRLTGCANRAGEAGMMLFKTTGTAILMFLVSIAVATVSGRSL